MAARVHSYAERKRSNHRATLAVLFGIVAALAVPVGIEITRKISSAVLLDAAYAIPVAALAAVASIFFGRGARAVRGSRRLLAGRILAVTGVCFALSGTIAVVLYEILLRLEH